MGLLLLPPISDQVLYHLPVQKRLPTEEIHFQIPPASGIRDQEIQRLLSHLITHQGSAAMIFPFFRKTVAARQIAVVGDMQAERLHHRFLRLYDLLNIIFIDILGIELSCRDQFLQICRCLS